MRRSIHPTILALVLIPVVSHGQDQAEPAAATGTIRCTVDYGPIPRAPANRVELILLRQAGEAEGKLHQARPDDSGVFVIEQIPVGRWDLALHASDEKYNKFMTYGVAEVRAGATAEVALTVPAGSARLEVRSEDNPPYMIGLFRPGVEVRQEDITSPKRMEEFGRLFDQKTHSRKLVWMSHGDNSTRTFPRLPAGSFELVICANDWQTGDPPLRPKKITVTLREDATTTLRLTDKLRGAQLPASDVEGAWKSIEEYWRTQLPRAGIVGSSLMLVHRGETLAETYAGHADLATRREVDAETIYHWASCTKTFTGIAIMQLIERGRLALDDPIVKYLPELRACHDPHGAMEAITLEHLLSHSAGFRGRTWPWGGDEPWHPHEPARWEQLVAMFPYTEVLFEPGSRYSYSNPGIVFLGRTLELLCGEDFEVYLEKNVLRPLGMRHSYFDHTPYHLLRHRSNNYRIQDGKPVAQGLDFDTGITVSNGGLNAPLTDMARYLAFLAGAPGLDEDARGVLPRSALREMWKPRVPLSQRSTTSHMGLTFFLYEDQGHRIVGHTGGQKAFVTFFLVDLDSGAGALGAFNTLGGPAPGTGTISATVQRRIRSEVFPLLRGA
jgi:CubicO group peptidase (beta-lactamase class C family)